MDKKPYISIVSPIYKAEKIVPELVRRIVTSVEKITQDYEVVLVCDGSPDQSWLAIQAECAKNEKIVGINLSRNFGQHYALSAGLKYSLGEWVVIMDCDLQDQPEEIENLLAKAKEGYDIVYAQRVERQDTTLKKLSSAFFYAVFNWLSGIESDKSIANFGVYHRRVIDVVNRMPEKARDVAVLISTLGFRHTAIPVHHAERYEGHSSYDLLRSIRLSGDIILSNSNRPLKICVHVGLVLSAVSMLLALYNVVAGLCGIITVEGYTTTVFSIWFVGGLILAELGVLGMYIGKIFDQVKDRPLYIVRDVINRPSEEM